MLEELIEIGIEHDAATNIQKSPTVGLLEVPAEHGVGDATMAVVDGQTDLLINSFGTPMRRFCRSHPRCRRARPTCARNLVQTSLPYRTWARWQNFPSGR